MFQYYDKNKWSNSVAAHLVSSTLVWLAINSLLLAAAIHFMQLSFFLFAFSVALSSGLWLFYRAQTSIAFPLVEVCDRHLILNMQGARRSVYDLECIEGARFFGHILYFRHNGWPVVFPLLRLPKTLRASLLELLEPSHERS